MKCILLLTFLLASLPGQSVPRLHIDRTPDFVAIFDQIQALPTSDKCNKKFEIQSEDELFLPSETVLIAPIQCPAPLVHEVQAPRTITSIPYPIRGPPYT